MARFSKKLKVTLVISLALITAIIIVFYTSSRSESPSIASDLKSVLGEQTDTVYYPAYSADYELLDSTVQVRSDISSYQIANGYSNITVTQQELPEDFTPSVYFYNNDSGEKKFENGKYYNISIEGQTRYMVITTDKKLLFITADSKIDEKIIIDIVSSVKPI